MKEMIRIKMAEINAWACLADVLDDMEQDERRTMAACYRELDAMYPDAGDEEARQSDFRYVEIQKIKAKLIAYENVRAVMQNAIG